MVELLVLFSSVGLLLATLVLPLEHWRARRVPPADRVSWSVFVPASAIVCAICSASVYAWSQDPTSAVPYPLPGEACIPPSRQTCTPQRPKMFPM